MDTDNWRGQFAQGFASTGGGNDGALWVVLVVLGVLAALGALYYFANRAPRKTSGSGTRSAGAATSRPPVDPDLPVLGKLKPVTTRVNPLQQKILHELIDEFRQTETSAQAVPVAVLEKYSEFFFENVKKLKTNEADVREFVNRNYPIKEGYGVEMDFQASGVMHLIKSKVLEVGAKTITVAYDGQVLAFMKRGNELLLNYNVGKHFLQGATTIAEVVPRQAIVVRKPQRISLTSERRYARVNLKNVFGTLQDPKRNYKTSVRVMDLSLEGVRIQVEKPLDKHNVHQLVFDVTVDGRPLAFGPIDCVPSKAFFTGTGTYESGLVFLYLDVSTRTKLTAYMNHLAKELQEARAQAGN